MSRNYKSDSYRIKNPKGMYFVSFATVFWILKKTIMALSIALRTHKRGRIAVASREKTKTIMNDLLRRKNTRQRTAIAGVILSVLKETTTENLKKLLSNEKNHKTR